MTTQRLTFYYNFGLLSRDEYVRYLRAMYAVHMYGAAL